MTVPGLIDFHTHLFPEARLQEMLADCEQRFWPPRYRGSLDELAQRLDDADLDRYALMPFATGRGQARELNRWTALFAREHPRAVPLATFHPSDPDLPDLVDEAFDDLKLAGAELHCQLGQFYPDDRRLFPLYERALEQEKVVVFHVARAPLRSRFVGAETFYQLLRHFPRLPAVVASLGADEVEAFFDLVTLFDGLCLDTSLVYCDRFSWQPRLERVIEFQDRIVYASGFPTAPCDLLRGVDAIQRLKLGPGIERKIFHTNAARLLGLAAI